MSPKQMKSFEKFLSDSFGDGIYYRELRLSSEEIEYLKKKFPKATIKRCEAAESADDKEWWEINLLAPLKNRTG